MAFGAEVVTGQIVLEILREQEKVKMDKEQGRAKTEANKKIKKSKKLAITRRKKIIEFEDDISEESEAFSIHDSDNETLDEIVEREEEDVMGMAEVSSDITSRHEGDWLLVKFATKKTIKYFVAQIQEISDMNEPFVKFARKANSKRKGSVFIFPETDDMSLISNDDIECILPKPAVCRRGQFQFPIDFSYYNIQ